MDTSTTVKQAMLRFYECVNSGDVSILDRLFSRQLGGLAIGTDPQEWWVGHEVVLRIYGTQLRELGGAVKLESGGMSALAEGTVGWVADRVTCRVADGSTLPVRMTAVFHQEGGEWKMVQLHASVGVANVEAVGKELTTQ